MNDESDGYRFRYARWCGMLGAEVKMAIGRLEDDERRSNELQDAAMKELAGECEGAATDDVNQAVIDALRRVSHGRREALRGLREVIARVEEEGERYKVQRASVS